MTSCTVEGHLTALGECLHCVTDNYNAMSDLLKYGLIRISVSEVVTDLSIKLTDPNLVESVERH